MRFLLWKMGDFCSSLEVWFFGSDLIFAPARTKFRFPVHFLGTKSPLIYNGFETAKKGASQNRPSQTTKKKPTRLLVVEETSKENTKKKCYKICSQKITQKSMEKKHLSERCHAVNKSSFVFFVKGKIKFNFWGFLNDKLWDVGGRERGGPGRGVLERRRGDDGFSRKIINLKGSSKNGDKKLGKDNFI